MWVSFTKWWSLQLYRMDWYYTYSFHGWHRPIREGSMQGLPCPSHMSWRLLCKNYIRPLTIIRLVSCLYPLGCLQPNHVYWNLLWVTRHGLPMCGKWDISTPPSKNSIILMVANKYFFTYYILKSPLLGDKKNHPHGASLEVLMNKVSTLASPRGGVSDLLE